MKTKFWILASVVLLFSPVIAAGIDASLLNQYPDPARAGDVVEVRVKLQNPSGEETGEVWIETMPEYPFTLLSGEQARQVVEAPSSYPVEASTKIVTFKFRIDPEAKDGVYKLSFRHSSNNGVSWISYDFNIRVTAVEFAEISSVKPTKIMPGKETELTFTITNRGNAPLQNMVFSWSEDNDVILPVGSGNTKYIKYLGPGESTDLKFMVVAGVEVEPDLYKLDLNLKYDLITENGTVSASTVTTQAGIFVGGETDFDVTFSESSAGQTSLSVANIGANRALSVTVKVPQQDNYQVSGSNAAIIGNLDKGDYTIVSFEISSSFSPTSMQGLSREEIQAMRQEGSTIQRNNTLKVLIEYTDTTGVRQTVEKQVPINFRDITTTDSSTTTYTRNGRSSTQQLWQNPLVIGGVVVVLVGVGFWYFKIRPKKNPAKKLLNKKKLIK